VFDQLVGEDWSLQRLVIMQNVPDVHIPMKLVAKTSGNDVVQIIPYADMRLKRRGSEEV
jgi:hypothetical protein